MAGLTIESLCQSVSDALFATYAGHARRELLVKEQFTTDRVALSGSVVRTSGGYIDGLISVR